MIIYVIGGKAKYDIVADKLNKSGYTVFRINESKELVNIVRESTVLLPVPLTNDGETVMGTDISIDDVFKSEAREFLGGKDKYKRTVDITTLDGFAYKNAVPTAEAAIMLGIKESKETLFSSKILISGFGHIGKILASRLASFGAQITVSARKSEDLSLIESYGYKAVLTSNIEDIISDYDFVFNTVPSLIYSESVLKKAENCIFIELASENSGFDMNYINNSNINFISALGLPGKYSPNTAANIIANTVNEYLIKKQ